MALQLTERENTLEIFDNFYSQSLNVNASEWDSVYSYFLGVLKGNPESASVKKTASQFATVLFQISQETGTNIQMFLLLIKQYNATLYLKVTTCLGKHDTHRVYTKSKIHINM